MTVNEKLKAYIQKRGIKQSVIANAIGMNERTLNGILNGRITLKVNTLVSVCEFIRVDPAFFLNDNTL